jgi:muconolactone delta-isomerase
MSVPAYADVIVLNRRPGPTLRVLVSPASGAVGGTAVQLAKEAGAHVVAIAGGDQRTDHAVRVLGADAAVDYRDPAFPERVREAAQHGIFVTMITHVPDGTPEVAVGDIRARAAAHSRELAAQGHLLRLWRPPLQPGEWRSLGLFAAGDGAGLETILASLPLDAWMTVLTAPLTRHPSDPGVSRA